MIISESTLIMLLIDTVTSSIQPEIGSQTHESIKSVNHAGEKNQECTGGWKEKVAHFARLTKMLVLLTLRGRWSLKTFTENLPKLQILKKFLPPISRMDQKSRQRQMCIFLRLSSIWSC